MHEYEIGRSQRGEEYRAYTLARDTLTYEISIAWDPPMVFKPRAYKTGDFLNPDRIYANLSDIMTPINYFCVVKNCKG